MPNSKDCTDECATDSRIPALEQRIAQLDAYAHTAAHELRGPLLAISGFAASLERNEAQNMSDVGRSRLARIVQVATQMDRLIANLLSLARCEHIQVAREPVAVDELVRDILDELREAYPRTRVAVGDLKPIHADAAVVRQVLANVIGNAFKYSHRQDGPLVQIGLASDGAFLVSDNGVGFPSQEAARVFMPFERMTSDPAYPGSGLGLAIVRQLLDRHGGWISASSREGGPTEFRFSFGEE